MCWCDDVYRITTRWSGRDLVSTRTAHLPVPPTWLCPAPTRSCPPSNSARKWRNWRRSKKNSRYTLSINSMSYRCWSAESASKLNLKPNCWTLLIQYRMVIGRWTCDQKVSGSTPGHSTFMQQPSASCSHMCASITKQYNLVPAQRRWCLMAGKVTVASHWPCVTDSVVYPPTGSVTQWPRKGRWAPCLRSSGVRHLYLCNVSPHFCTRVAFCQPFNKRILYCMYVQMYFDWLINTAVLPFERLWVICR